MNIKMNLEQKQQIKHYSKATVRKAKDALEICPESENQAKQDLINLINYLEETPMEAYDTELLDTMVNIFQDHRYRTAEDRSVSFKYAAKIEYTSLNLYWLMRHYSTDYYQY